jgi:hypothetical protein
MFTLTLTFMCYYTVPVVYEFKSTRRYDGTTWYLLVRKKIQLESGSGTMRRYYHQNQLQVKV